MPPSERDRLRKQIEILAKQPEKTAANLAKAILMLNDSHQEEVAKLEILNKRVAALEAKIRR